MGSREGGGPARPRPRGDRAAAAGAVRPCRPPLPGLPGVRGKPRCGGAVSCYVRPERRGGGHGKALLTELARICVERGYERLEWSVLDWNAPSIAFYESLGARPQDEWTVYRLTDGALASLGGGGTH
ncbi:GNAT family N-acetyltransferase [Streptomyces fimicarius]|uniref:GNAT family N-acetyltransferase n=1 Tax=Streptomyces griseus TaxID=1911 RepID=UPI003674665B